MITGKEKAWVALAFGILGAVAGVVQPWVSNHGQINAGNWIQLAAGILSALTVYIVPNSPTSPIIQVPKSGGNNG